MDKTRLLHDLMADYRSSHPRSEKFFHSAQQILVKGGSHNLRLFAPFPFYDAQCHGSKITDIDGNTYVDFWQGHFGNILGHNPEIVLNALQTYFQKGLGLLTGFPGESQKELAEVILSRIKADSIRFTTSGTLASMYAIMLAKSFTGRNLVLKIGGGWHGAQPYALKGITAFAGGLDQMESAGLNSLAEATILTTEFNNVEELEERFLQRGEQIACLIIEPFIGAGGFIFGEKEYISKTRELTSQYGALLIFDEVISGFRFHAGGIQTLYGVEPDLSIFGKAIGGGMPVAALAGKGEILSLCDSTISPEKRVKFEGGTFSSHPASMLAGLTFIHHLIENEDDIYPRIGRLGAKVRKEIEAIFTSHGFNVKCSGGDDSVISHSSIAGVHFLKTEIDIKKVRSPNEVWDPQVNDFELRESIFKLAMLKEGFNTFHGYGAISSAHTEEEIQASLDAVERIANHWKKYYFS